jgi:hypothetical protein
METLRAEKLELVSCSLTFFRAASPSEHSQKQDNANITSTTFLLFSSDSSNSMVHIV